MSGSRQRFVIALGLIMALAPGASGLAAGADGAGYPDKPITVVVGYAAGGGQDSFTRVLATRLSEQLGQPLQVVNRPGAAGTVAAAEVAHARPDGYTLYSAFISNITITPHLNKVPYGLDDLVPIVQITSLPLVMAAGPKLHVSDWQGLVEYAKAHPRRLTYGTDGVGGLPHLASERIFRAAGIELRMIPFKGSAESSAAALGGHVDVYVGSIGPVVSHVKEGTLKGILVTSAEPQAVLPGLPGLKAIGRAEIATEAWRGLFAPKGTPKGVVQRLANAARELANDSSFVELMRKAGEEIAILGPEEFERRIRAEYEDFGRIAGSLKNP
ncbi:MAG TPA: tripartite tricarboxylate transporter substrate binding protein [Thermodesulfobacteriota bacterium]